MNKSLAPGDLPWWSEEDDDNQIEKRHDATEMEIKVIHQIQLRMDLNHFLAQIKRMKVTGSASIPTQPRCRPKTYKKSHNFAMVSKNAKRIANFGPNFGYFV